MRNFLGIRSPKGWAGCAPNARPVAVPLWHHRQRSRLCRIFISPPNLMLIMIKAKQFHSPSLLHNAGILATCPVVHNQPKTTWFSPNSALWSVLSLSCSELWMKRVLEALGSAQESLKLPVNLSLLQSGSGSVLPCKTVQSTPANLPGTTWSSPS